MLRRLLFASALMLQLLPIACAGHAGAPDVGNRRRTVDVMCNSTVSHDTGACKPRAEERCGGRARLVGVVSSVEVTGGPTGRLYTITARYKCEGA